MASSTKRIEYIDALRGFTMMLVVITHVAFFCMDIKEDSNYHHYLSQIRMPLFFLISGFVMYKEGVIWNLQHIGVFLKKKFIVQIVSTLFFFTLFSHYKNVDFIEGLKDPWKLGYWFTYTLFIYFVFYSAIRYICRKYVDVVIVIVAAVFYVINWPPLYQLIPIPDSLKSFLGVENGSFFVFFC